MKSIFTKLFLVSALSVTGISYAQYYPNDDYGNNYGYEYYYDEGGVTIIQTNIIMNILMIITPMIYIEDIIMITGTRLSASIGTDFL